MTCSIPDCSNSLYSKGWCEAHYKRNRRYGSPYYFPVGANKMRQGEWVMILSMEPMPDLALDYLVGSSGPWRKHCAKFKKNLKRRIETVRKMDLTQQCDYYRGIAFVRAGQ